ncbi:hypothetical protein TNCV_145211 [Trichonephila clavipes]|nr:hypothetical protein TNCV_145211 [Trichonephila clavipes]
MDYNVEQSKDWRLAIPKRRYQDGSMCAPKSGFQIIELVCKRQTRRIVTSTHPTKRYYYKKLRVPSKLGKNIKDLDIRKKPDKGKELVRNEYIFVIDSSIKEFSVGFSQFKELSEMPKFIM